MGERLENAHVVFRFEQSSAEKIGCSAINAQHIMVNDEDTASSFGNDGPDREDTPFGGKSYVYFGLIASHRRSAHHLMVGSAEGKSDNSVDFEIIPTESRKSSRVSHHHFTLTWNEHKAWIVVDKSVNGTWIDNVLVASDRLRHHAKVNLYDIESTAKHLALHPVKWTPINAGTLEFEVKVGEAAPPESIHMNLEGMFENLGIQSNITTTSKSTMPITPPQGELTPKEQFYKLPCAKNIPSGTQVVMRKLDGQRYLATPHEPGKTEHSAGRTFHLLKDILRAGRAHHLLSLSSFVQEAGQWMTLSQYWDYETLQHCLPLPHRDLESIFLQTNSAVAYLHSKNTVHGNISLDTILISFNSGGLVEACLTGFSTAICERTDQAGLQTSKTQGDQDHSQENDVFSECGVIQECLIISEIKSPMEAILLEGRLADRMKRPTAKQIHERIEKMTGDSCPDLFQPLKLESLFSLIWCCQDFQTFIRARDIERLVNVYADTIKERSSFNLQTCTIKGRHVGDYCSLRDAQKLMEHYELERYYHILPEKSSLPDVEFQVRERILSSIIYYQPGTQFFNLTTLLRFAVSPEEATRDINPPKQEVHGREGLEGIYTDRTSFELVLTQVQKQIDVQIDLLSVPNYPRRGEFASVNNHQYIMMVTPFLLMPWVLLKRDQVDKNKEKPCDLSCTTVKELQQWCNRYDVPSIGLRVQKTIQTGAFSNWKYPRRVTLIKTRTKWFYQTTSDDSEQLQFNTNRRKKRILRARRARQTSTLESHGSDGDVNSQPRKAKLQSNKRRKKSTPAEQATQLECPERSDGNATDELSECVQGPTSSNDKVGGQPRRATVQTSERRKPQSFRAKKATRLECTQKGSSTPTSWSSNGDMGNVEDWLATQLNGPMWDVNSLPRAGHRQSRPPDAVHTPELGLPLFQPAAPVTCDTASEEASTVDLGLQASSSSLRSLTPRA